MKKKNVIIIGAGVAGTDVCKEISKSPSLGLDVVGFIDDDETKVGLNVGKIKVLGTKKDLPKLIKEKNIGQVVVAIPSASGKSIAGYVNLCSKERIDVRIVPRVKEIIEGKARVSTLRKVRVEDLLGRPVVKTDVIELKKFFKNKKVLITGAAGSIGSELSRQVAAYKPKKLMLFDWWENGVFEMNAEIKKGYPRVDIECVVGNIQDTNKVRNVIHKLKPNYVFHAAAYKHVPLMEEFPEEAVKNNIFGTLNVIKEAYKSKVEKFVLVSTDKAACPRNVMGATKLITETLGTIYNARGKTKFMAVRFGNVLDSNGSVVPIFRKQIDSGGPLTVTNEKMTRYFMTIPEAAQLILKAANMGNGGELFVLDMGQPVKILDLAESMIRLSGLIPHEDIEIVITGVRKGEKIHERLFNKNEKNVLVKTKDKKIFMTESLGLDTKKVKERLPNLRAHAESGDRVAIRKELSKLIKSFKI